MFIWFSLLFGASRSTLVLQSNHYFTTGSLICRPKIHCYQCLGTPKNVWFTPPKINSSPMKNDSLKSIFLFGMIPFQRRTSWVLVFLFFQEKRVQLIVFWSTFLGYHQKNTFKHLWKTSSFIIFLEHVLSKCWWYFGEAILPTTWDHHETLWERSRLVGSGRTVPWRVFQIENNSPKYQLIESPICSTITR